jgi:hypothetical protein
VGAGVTNRSDSSNQEILAQGTSTAGQLRVPHAAMQNAAISNDLTAGPQEQIQGSSQTVISTGGWSGK